MKEGKSRSEFLTPALSGFIGTMITAALAAVVFTFASQMTVPYGYGVFCALPLSLGYFSALIVSTEGDVLTYRRCAVSAMWTMLYSALSFFVFVFEGLVCIGMAAPIAIPLALLGALLAFGTRK